MRGRFFAGRRVEACTHTSQEWFKRSNGEGEDIPGDSADLERNHLDNCSVSDGAKAELELELSRVPWFGSDARPRMNGTEVTHLYACSHDSKMYVCHDHILLSSRSRT